MHHCHRAGIAENCPKYEEVPVLFDAGVSQVVVPQTGCLLMCFVFMALLFFSSFFSFFFHLTLFYVCLFATEEAKEKKKESKEAEKNKEDDEIIDLDTAASKSKIYKDIPSRCAYSSEELDILALFFTVIKIFFISGTLQVIPALIKIIGLLFLSLGLLICFVCNWSIYLLDDVVVLIFKYAALRWCHHGYLTFFFFYHA